MNNTTRSHPRTLKDAFKGVDYACSVERRRPADRAVNWTLFAAVIAIIASLVWQARP